MKEKITTKEAPQKRNYDAAFQRSAAEMVIVGGKSMVEVARDLGINKYTLKNWKNKTLKEMGEVRVNGQVRSATDLESENRALRKELEYVKRQREILKKAMSIRTSNFSFDSAQDGEPVVPSFLTSNCGI